MLNLDTYVNQDTQYIINEKYLRQFEFTGGYYRKIRRSFKKRKLSKNRKNYFGGMPIEIPDWVNVVDYRTMNDKKKQCAVDGCHCCQTEWMLEEVNEFYEAVSIGNRDEIEDEAMGLIRAYQQFASSADVVEIWKKVRNDVLKVFSNRELFEKAFTIWHEKKLKKKQAIGVTSPQLIDVAGLQWE
jgi:hypothetical protein